MNEVYFFCDSCQVYRNAGYRHAYMTLSNCGVIDEGLLAGEPFFASVDGDGVLACAPYWAEEGKPGELAERLRGVRAFLRAHTGHPLSFGDIHRILGRDASWYDWMNEDGDDDLSPRYLAERLRLASWKEVEGLIAAGHRPPWWWKDEASDTRTAARKKFEALVGGRKL